MQHLQPVPERNTQILEMLVGQGDNSDINVVLGKPLSILGHADLFERVRNLLHRDLPDGYIVIRLNLEQGDRGFIRFRCGTPLMAKPSQEADRPRATCQRLEISATSVG